jgi:hypothetical protein
VLRKVEDIKFWYQWLLANAVAELIGLGSIAALGYGIFNFVGDPNGLASIALATIFVCLGALEGYVVGLAQYQVMKRHHVIINGWIHATIVGAIVAWAVGMAPSTIMSFIEPVAPDAPPIEIAQWQRLAFASALGLVAGPVLAFFQWRRLRVHYPKNALWWLPANAVAWAFGMPVVFMGVHLAATSTSAMSAVASVGVSLLVAGAVVGAVHGSVLVCLLGQGRNSASSV